ncbi:MAG: hypothetical protein ACRC10_01570 [Thermoguttaceae bacterium]
MSLTMNLAAKRQLGRVVTGSEPPFIVARGCGRVAPFTPGYNSVVPTGLEREDLTFQKEPT